MTHSIALRKTGRHELRRLSDEEVLAVGGAGGSGGADGGTSGGPSGGSSGGTSLPTCDLPLPAAMTGGIYLFPLVTHCMN